MRVVLKNAEVMNVADTEKGRLVEVLHENGHGKEVVKIWYFRTTKKGEPLVVPTFKPGDKYNGTVQFSGLMSPVPG